MVHLYMEHLQIYVISKQSQAHCKKQCAWLGMEDKVNQSFMLLNKLSTICFQSLRLLAPT